MSVATKGVFIVAAKRTPFGTFGGKLAGKSSIELAELATKAALASIKLDPKLIDSAVYGNVIVSSSADGGFLPRHAMLRSGIPLETPALGVNRLCGTGFQAVASAAQSIILGEANIAVAGGAENMSQSPFCVRNVRFGTKLGQKYELEDTLWVGLTDSYCKTPMGVTAENLATKFNLTRDEIDKFALRSQQLWKHANDSGYFKEEMAPITLTIKKKEVTMDTDEHPRPQTTLEELAKLPTVFKKDGVVTAGTSSGINDGAGTIILANEESIKKHNLTPLARLVGYSVVGVEPTIMGIGPSPAIKKLLNVTGKTLNDIDLVEINEAFAAQTLACQKDLGLDINKLNVNGGAVAVGHPLAASGSRITAHLVHELRRRKAKYGIGSACIGGGQGIALMLESL